MASFVGKKYKLDKSENFDEYMKELGKCSSRIKTHELESSKKCYVNWWQMPCKEVAKRREPESVRKKNQKHAIEKQPLAGRRSFFFLRRGAKRKEEMRST